MRAAAIEAPGQVTVSGFLERAAERAEARDPMRPATRLFLIVLAMLGIGFLLQISHASTTSTREAFRTEAVEQLSFRLAALTILLAAYRFGPSRLRPALPYLLSLGFVALVGVFFKPFGGAINGSCRWLSIFGVSFQPSELVRLLVVLWIADRCVRLGSRVSEMRRGLLPMLVFTLIFFSLILIETDLGGSMVLLMCGVATMWIGGASPGPIAAMAVLVGGGGVAGACTFVPYIRNRMAMFFGGVENEQVRMTGEALASGGVGGGGLTHGPYRNAGVPYLESDYVFAMVGEELGLFGLLLVIGLWVAFLWFSAQLVMAIRDRFEAIATFGLLLSVFVPALIHMQVVVGLVPPKGMTLPFLSNGGTSLLVSSLAVGLALGAARRSHKESIDAYH